MTARPRLIAHAHACWDILIQAFAHALAYRLRCTLMAVLCLSVSAASGSDLDQAYQSWANGLPQEAAVAIHHQADDDWTRWFDAGLAYHEAGLRVEAITCLVEAYRLNPAAQEPRGMLAELGVTLPHGWYQTFGPMALPQMPWWPVGGLLLATLCLGYAFGRRVWHRSATRHGETDTLGASGAASSTRPAQSSHSRLLWLGLVILVTATPAVMARYFDHRPSLAVVVAESSLLNGSGQVIADGTLAAGSVVQVDQSQAAWQGRHLVTDLATGQRGWLAQGDLSSSP